MTRLGQVHLDGPIDTLALKYAIDTIRSKGWNASVVTHITPHSDGSVRMEGRHWHENGDPRLFVVTARANGSVTIVAG